MTQRLILLLQLELHLFLLRLHLLRYAHYPANQFFLAPMRQFIQPCVHFAANIIDSLVKLEVKLVGNASKDLLRLLYLR